MKNFLIAGTVFALFAGSAMAQTATPPTVPGTSAAPTSADRTVGAVGSERGNNASSLNGTNAASGTYSGANAPSNTDAGRTGGGSGGGAGGAGGGAGGGSGGN